ncbi:MAG: endonuclease III [Actinomycetota bacterium]|nr:endonuclease III [Actinomycetota bacterium]
MILTILSQHTSDTNSSRAFAALKNRFPSWSRALEAPTRDIAGAIRPGGIAEIKAGRIKQILWEIREREGRLGLTRLSNLPDSEVFDYLTSLTGVGPKTAACVLVFSMGRAAFPVDTHVHRVTKRLGLVPDDATAEQTQRLLEPRIPPEIRYEFHVQLVRHGREICRPRLPLCSDCPLLDLCPAGARFIATGEAGALGNLRNRASPPGQG